jgi:hypothetical protein
MGKQKNTTQKIKITMTIPLDVALTLVSLLDGSIGTADDDEFVKQMQPIIAKLDRRIIKYLATQYYKL